MPATPTSSESRLTGNADADMRPWPGRTPYPAGSLSTMRSNPRFRTFPALLHRSPLPGAIHLIRLAGKPPSLTWRRAGS
jgi:hypothetical protein